jgi:hypothetical protein
MAMMVVIREKAVAPVMGAVLAMVVPDLAVVDQAMAMGRGMATETAMAVVMVTNA